MLGKRGGRSVPAQASWRRGTDRWRALSPEAARAPTSSGSSMSASEARARLRDRIAHELGSIAPVHANYLYATGLLLVYPDGHSHRRLLSCAGTPRAITPARTRRPADTSRWTLAGTRAPGCRMDARSTMTSTSPPWRSAGSATRNRTRSPTMASTATSPSASPRPGCWRTSPGRGSLRVRFSNCSGESMPSVGAVGRGCRCQHQFIDGTAHASRSVSGRRSSSRVATGATATRPPARRLGDHAEAEVTTGHQWQRRRRDQVRAANDQTSPANAAAAVPMASVGVRAAKSASFGE